VAVALNSYQRPCATSQAIGVLLIVSKSDRIAMSPDRQPTSMKVQDF